MRNTILSLVLCCLLLAAAGVHDASAANRNSERLPPAWSLAEAVDFALKNNPDIHVAQQRLAASAAMTDAARAATLPSVSLSAEYSQTDTPMYSFGNILNEGAFDNSIDFNDPGRTDDLQAKATVQYRLYDGGNNRAGVDGAAAESRATAGQLDVVHQQLAFAVVRSYNAILQAEEMVRVREAAVAAIEASLLVGRARFEAGDLLKEDLLNLELQQAREMENRIRGRHDLTLARQVFWNLLGRGSDHADDALPVQGEPQKVPRTLDYRARKELQSLDNRITAAEAGLERARSGARPAVDTFAQYQFDHGTVLESSGNSWQAGVRLNYSLYNGNRTEAEIAAAQARLAEMKAMKARTELALGLELQQAEIAYQQSLERLQVTAKMVEVAEESAQLSRSRFQEGVILASDLIDTEMRLTDAQARRAAARTENSIAIANLRRAVGVGQFPESR